jgi:asparagine synthase (glutamine-hydrolysing)
MCGIVGGFSPNIEQGIEALLHRGPDAQGSRKIGSIFFGHTRLSILDLDPRSNQPFEYDGLHLIFNGEIWNYLEIRDRLILSGYRFVTSGDTEVVAAALHKWGINALNILNGMFALAWTTDGETLYLGRDSYGECPLHYAKQKPFFFASELKALKALGAHPKSYTDLPPGHYAKITAAGIEQRVYWYPQIDPSEATIEEASRTMFELLHDAVIERTIADVPVCTLLSGGIDSAIIAFFAKQIFPDLVAYTAVLDPRSPDLRAARLVAQHLDIELREVGIDIPDVEDLRAVIRQIEMPFKAQVEIGHACIRLAEQMRADGFKVTFSGEGSDELWASYGFSYHGLKEKGWHEYRRDLFLDQARKNFPRSNKIFMAHSIECRLPFLNPRVVQYALNLKQSAVQRGKSRPKAVLQEAFEGLLPDLITRRPKMAFQDALGLKTAISNRIHNPKELYKHEYSRLYQ